MEEVKAEIVAVGTELLLGQIANTNAQWLSRQLADRGINVFYHSVVGDNLKRVTGVFREAGRRSDLVIVTGGLGPTDDDLTREAFRQLTGQALTEDPKTMEKIEAYFRKAGRPMTPNNRKQALVFTEADVFLNQEGMAPGMAVKQGETCWIFLPGVPREMKHLADTYVFPYLQDMFRLNHVILSRMLRFIGIGESQLEHELRHLIAAQTNPTIAPLAAEGEVALRLTAKASSDAAAKALIEDAETEVLKTTASFYYGRDEERLEEKILQMLGKTGKTIASAESLTGGMFMEQLTAIPGASSFCQGSIVSYTVEAKKQLLQVNPETIERYGTVSEQCAREMASQACKLLQADIAVSFTGVAGPDGAEGKQPGTVFIALSHQGEKSLAESFSFSGNRETVRRRAAKKGLELLWKYLKQQVDTADTFLQNKE